MSLLAYFNEFYRDFFRVRCYGPGIEPSGPIVNAPANFTVETFAAGKGKKILSSKIPQKL